MIISKFILMLKVDALNKGSIDFYNLGSTALAVFENMAI